ncbi:hypothetical protein MAUB1S_04915 [Mycolicibacterium aubagnense]
MSVRSEQLTLAVSVGSDPVARRRPDRLACETSDLFTGAGPAVAGHAFGTDGVLVDHLK